jgi:hypothetical protein
MFIPARLKHFYDILHTSTTESAMQYIFSDKQQYIKEKVESPCVLRRYLRPTFNSIHLVQKTEEIVQDDEKKLPE